MPRVVKHHNTLDEDDEGPIDDSSSSEELDDAEKEDAEDEEEDDVDEEGDGRADAVERSTAEKTTATIGTWKATQGTNRRQTAAPGSLKLSLCGKNDVCRVCGKRGHKAGFVGATYMDCPNRPCYLCKQVGHTTATCPYRIAPGHDCTAATDTATRGSVGSRSSWRSANICTALQGRECSGGRHPVRPQRPSVPRYQVEAAILKVHSRRCCTLEFHPTNDSVVVSGDKKGGLAVWNFDQVHERTVYDTVHSCLANSIRFLPWVDSMSVVTASSDGTAKLVDLETGDWRPLLDLNPGGWVEGGPWHMVYGCDASPALGSVLVGDSNGCVHLLDPRTRGSVCSLQLHRKGNKVVSVHMHPLHPVLVLTAGNDHSARIFDIRELSSAHSAAPLPGTPPPPATAAAAAVATARTALAGSLLSASPVRATADGGYEGPSEASTPKAAAGKRGGRGGGRGSGRAGTKTAGTAATSHAEIAVMPHPRVVNAAYFSPHSGRRILTTCQDNRLRIWDYAPYSCNGPADREIVHSHDFNRHLTPFKAEWDTKDLTETVFTVGRYISEDFGGVALHPVDILSASDGALLRQLTDGNLTTISPVNKPHPRRELIVSGSSRSLYLWAPVREEEEDEEEEKEDPGRLGAGRSGAGGAATSAARASRTFISFDADPRGGKKRKKSETKGAKVMADDDDGDGGGGNDDD